MDEFTNEELSAMIQLFHESTTEEIFESLHDRMQDELERRIELAEFADECEGGACKL